MYTPEEELPRAARFPRSPSLRRAREAQDAHRFIVDRRKKSKNTIKETKLKKRRFRNSIS